MYILLSLELTIPHARFCGLELGIQHISDSGLGYRLGLGLMFALVWHMTLGTQGNIIMCGVGRRKGD